MVRIVFFGSGPVAAKSLELLSSNFDIECVVTKRSPSGHKGTVPVLDVSERLGLKVIQTTGKTNLDELIEQEDFNSTVGVLIDFGIIVSRKVIDSFPNGIVNSHFSLLPEWRGADPISYALLSGQSTTGVSLMLLTEKMDEGRLIGLGEQPIEHTDNSESLTEKLIELSDSLLTELLPAYLSNKRSVSQEEAADLSHGRTVASYSSKLSKEDGEIDWSKPASVIEREVRAYQTWPKSHAVIGDVEVIITRAHCYNGQEDLGSKKVLALNCGKGKLIIDELKPAGKKSMPAHAFLAGYGSKLKN